jgi:quercetin 2,3-dioxygenase
VDGRSRASSEPLKVSDVGRFGVHRGNERFRTSAPGLDSRHSFSFGPHYDPENLGFGPLVVSNEDRLDAGAGFDRHAHRGVDIVTWMLAGTLEHEDSTGQRRRLTAGMAQRLRAGSGVHHAEHAASSQEHPAAHYVQMWLRSAGPDAPPDYAWADFAALLDPGGTPGLVTVASGDATDGAALMLDRPGAVFAVARLPTAVDVVIPAGPLLHVFVARGDVRLDMTSAQVGDQFVRRDQLFAGDAARITAAGQLTVIAGADAEILVWRLPG